MVLALTLPLVVELLVLPVAALFPAWRKVRSQPNSKGPMHLWAVVPAHNEEILITACVRSLLQANPPPASILVVAHNCTDSTVARAEQAGAIVFPLQDDGSGGKGAALQFGFAQAIARGADAVIVIDADSVVSKNLPAEVLAKMEAGVQALQCRYLLTERDVSTRTRLMALAFLGMNLLRPLGRCRLGLSCGLFGNGFALTRTALQQVPYGARSLVEDLEYHLLLLRAGIKVNFVDSAVVLGEMPQQSSAAATQRARWEGGRSRMRRQWTSTLLRDVLRGRWRMLEPLLDLLSLPLASGAILLLFALLIPVTWVRLYTTAGLLTFLIYVLLSASFATRPSSAIRALLSIPGYMFWKMINLPRTRLAARPNAAWVRTERNDLSVHDNTQPPGSR